MSGLTIQPFLMFQGEAEAAMTFYVSLFPDAKIINATRYRAGEAGKEGSLKTGEFAIAGQTILCFDSAVKHDFTFTPAFSLFVTYATEEQIDRLASALAEGGAVLMPKGDYGFSRQFAWVNDRYGVSWQLTLP